MKFNYFIENADDEADALYELEQEGFKWGVGENPTTLVISRIMGDKVFPYTISKGKDKKIYWYGEGTEETEDFNKYSVTQVFMQDLNNWRDDRRIYAEDGAVLGWEDFQDEPERVQNWRLDTGSAIEANKRLIAIINWLNGEDVFEIVTQKYVVQRKDAVLNGVHQYLNIGQSGNIHLIYGLENATHFDGFEKASEWANKHFEVVELNG